MVIKKVVRYGDWESPISVESVTSINKSLSSPRVHRNSERSYFIESKDNGNNTIVEVTNNGFKDVLPSKFSAHNTVYEYGGSPYDVLPTGQIIFSNKDNTVWLLDPGTGETVKVVASPTLRYSNFSANPLSAWVLAVEEDHELNAPASEVRNYVVAINVASHEVRRVLTGADFYYTPQFSPDGSKLAWLEWNHPDMPFSASKLYIADWNDGNIENAKLIAGKNRDGVAEPRWGPDGSLFYGREVDGYRRLFQIFPSDTDRDELELRGPEEAESGEISWLQGSQTYAPLSDSLVITTAFILGTSEMVLFVKQDDKWELSRVSQPENIVTEVKFDAMCALNSYSALIIGSNAESLQSLLRLFIANNTISAQNIHAQPGQTIAPFPKTLYSKPTLLRIPAKNRTIFAFLWPPHNPDFKASPGALPPAIVVSHGGPTGYSGPGLKLRIQYFTSRGYAVCALNYTGSTAHGRKYRESLFGDWGGVDADDAAETARYLVKTGRAREGGVGITGGSAGGYNTLQSLVRYPRAFAAGVCVCGVSDLKALGEGTHKLESKYLDALVVKEGMSEEEKEREFRARSPLFHAGKIQAPLLLLHGVEDTVVPIAQARSIEKVIREKGGDVRIVEVAGEGHMFGKPGSPEIWLKEEEKMWRRTLLES